MGDEDVGRPLLRPWRLRPSHSSSANRCSRASISRTVAGCHPNSHPGLWPKVRPSSRSATNSHPGLWPKVQVAAVPGLWRCSCDQRLQILLVSRSSLVVVVGVAIMMVKVVGTGSPVMVFGGAGIGVCRPFTEATDQANRSPDPSQSLSPPIAMQWLLAPVRKASTLVYRSAPENVTAPTIRALSGRSPKQAPCAMAFWGAFRVPVVSINHISSSGNTCGFLYPRP